MDQGECVQNIQCLVCDVAVSDLFYIDFATLLEGMEILQYLPFSIQKAFY